ncbi:hypothetical protein HBA54_27470 [Pelagibius litoralis]|uniref:Metal-dependent HD superfamily phosphohydrolase n=1 Tax=Pelagibius litoralis TaxID=374515 RepID=A0A967F3C4_9PROT|nr:hypothetical protein [Pelagibius litoralis]
MLPAPLTEDLRRRYGEPQRHYHTWAHVEALLGLFAEVRELLADPIAVEAALFYHDAVYDPRAVDNEAQSAALLRRDGAAVVAADSLETAARLIEATAGHQPPPGLSGAALEDARLFLDMDLSILAAPVPEFAAYEAAIRREYAHVDDAAFRQGRCRFLEGLLQREKLYHSDHFSPRFEGPARVNIARALAAPA